eukprot:1021478-Pleurochrysis_carterae.AAC.1
MGYLYGGYSTQIPPLGTPGPPDINSILARLSPPLVALVARGSELACGGDQAYVHGRRGVASSRRGS